LTTGSTGLTGYAVRFAAFTSKKLKLRRGKQAQTNKKENGLWYKIHGAWERNPLRSG
jgi:hypothetical protein